ncbi:unnamed protein product, partial [Medioppia subpectinata]
MLDMSLNRSRYEVPAELTNLLLDFTVSVLVNKPTDLLEYATIYFNRLLEERHHSSHSSHLLTNANDNENNHLVEDDNDSTSSDIIVFSLNHTKCVYVCV